MIPIVNNEIYYGSFIQCNLINDPNTSQELKEILKTNYRSNEILDLFLKPDFGVMVIKGKDKVSEVKLILKRQSQFLGSYYVEELLNQVSLLWDKQAVNKLKSFNSYDVITLMYYPDFQILRFATLDNLKVEYVTGVVWSSN